MPVVVYLSLKWVRVRVRVGACACYSTLAPRVPTPQSAKVWHVQYRNYLPPAIPCPFCHSGPALNARRRPPPPFGTGRRHVDGSGPARLSPLWRDWPRRPCLRLLPRPSPTSAGSPSTPLPGTLSAWQEVGCGRTPRWPTRALCAASRRVHNGVTASRGGRDSHRGRWIATRQDMTGRYLRYPWRASLSREIE